MDSGTISGPLTRTAGQVSPGTTVANHVKRQMFAYPLLILTDLCLLSLSIVAAYGIRIFLLAALIKGLPPTSAAYLYALWWAPVLAVVFFVFEKSYSRRIPFWQEAGHIVKTVTLAFLVVI
ncbi:MAG: hypothetical protein FWC60_06150, partial [Firmicutes bacterium]|nr:hypothetical protein [Bacillota bacterium]